MDRCVRYLSVSYKNFYSFFSYSKRWALASRIGTADDHIIAYVRLLCCVFIIIHVVLFRGVGLL